MRQAIATLTPDLVAIRNRVGRDTVNIGVIGRAKAGKSTLLRTITNLGTEAIPSTELNPTTAARSRILHSPGRAEAEITLLTWDEFRDSYLGPAGSRDAGCDGPVPPTPDAFAGHRYESMQQLSHGERDEGLLSKQKFLERLHCAQDSFPSYRPLLTGRERKVTIGQLTELRPFVAYPLDPANKHRPYHAVRDIRIFCEFPEVDVENLRLVDLPVPARPDSTLTVSSCRTLRMKSTSCCRSSGRDRTTRTSAIRTGRSSTWPTKRAWGWTGTIS